MIKKSESKIQQEIFQWFWNCYCLPKHQPREIMFHVPNENSHRLSSIGVLSGVSDLILTFGGVTYYCEVKTPTGRVSESQKRFESHINDVRGSEYFICRSLKEFQDKILSL